MDKRWNIFISFVFKRTYDEKINLFVYFLRFRRSFPSSYLVDVVAHFNAICLITQSAAHSQFFSSFDGGVHRILLIQWWVLTIFIFVSSFRCHQYTNRFCAKHYNFTMFFQYLSYMCRHFDFFWWATSDEEMTTQITMIIQFF